ncbi:TBC1 domain family member 15 [Hypsibius exemplaris]|uniref:TBC1 domain family member 15 n=1 Tax=Hypsibius exemplaris TaxID=2072580 RepID=A0A1W0X543_HYPEX|nr:TBC1 domain family member 15 [Hypsibius exemplaris]
MPPFAVLPRIMSSTSSTNFQSVDHETLRSWDGVFIIIPKVAHTNVIQVPEKVIGTLQIISKDKFGTYLEWLPWMDTLVTEDGSYSTQTNCTIFQTKDGSYRIPHVNIDIDDIKCFKIHGGESCPARLTFITNDGTSHATLELDEGAYQELIAYLQQRLLVERSAKDSHLCLVRDRRSRNTQPRRQPDLYDMPNQPPHFLQRLARNPVQSAFLGLSKVHSMLMTAVDTLAQPIEGDPSIEMSKTSDFQMPQLNVVQTTSNDDQDFEVISIKSPLELPPRRSVHRRSPLTASEWKSFFDSEGRISDEQASAVKDIIFKGGVELTIRKHVWKYLLGYYDWNSTMEEREGKRNRLSEEYHRMKIQWSTISSDQEKRFSIWRERKDLIEKDVHRTDRTHPFFEGKSTALKVMNEILLTYCMYNFDLGYVQGMSDLLTPLMLVMDGDEVDAFWTFNGLMERITHNFDMEKLMKELKDLSTVMKYLDPALKAYIDSNDPRLYFCFRWLLVQFKREFSFDDVMRLWEILWTGKPCKNFHLLFAYAILETEKNTLIENRFSSTEILRHINDLAMTIDLDKTLCLAEGIHQQLMGADELPTSIQKIIGLAPDVADGVRASLSSMDLKSGQYTPDRRTPSPSPNRYASSETSSPDIYSV